MKILCLKPFLRSAPIHPSAGENEEASNLLTHILYTEGHEVFVLPWEGEKVWNEWRFCVNEDYSYATALPTLYFPRITDLSKLIIRSFTQKKALKNPNKYIWKLIKSSFYKKRVFLQNAIKRSKANIVHSHYCDPEIIRLYSAQQYKTPIILTHFGDEVNKSILNYDYVIFTNKSKHSEAIHKFPDLTNKSTYINYSTKANDRDDFKQKHLNLYKKISGTTRIKTIKSL